LAVLHGRFFLRDEFPLSEAGESDGWLRSGFSATAEFAAVRPVDRGFFFAASLDLRARLVLLSSSEDERADLTDIADVSRRCRFS